MRIFESCQRAMQRLVVLSVAATLMPSFLFADDAVKPKKYSASVVKKAEDVLAQMKLRRVGKSIQSTSSAQISRAISGLSRRKRELRLIQQDWRLISDSIAANRQESKRLNAQYGELNLQLARVAGRDTSANNRIIGLINATVAKRTQ